MRAAAVFAAILAASCAREEAPPPDAASANPEPLKAIQLPADYVPGGIYGMDRSECDALGGAFATDGNGLSFCSLGAPYAVFVCEGGLIVSLIERDAGRKMLHLSTGDFAEALPAAGAGEIWATGDYTVTIAGDGATFVNVGETVECLPAA